MRARHVAKHALFMMPVRSCRRREARVLQRRMLCADAAHTRVGASRAMRAVAAGEAQRCSRVSIAFLRQPTITNRYMRACRVAAYARHAATLMPLFFSRVMPTPRLSSPRYAYMAGEVAGVVPTAINIDARSATYATKSVCRATTIRDFAMAPYDYYDASARFAVARGVLVPRRVDFHQRASCYDALSCAIRAFIFLLICRGCTALLLMITVFRC